MNAPPFVLTIAGSDCSGGAGLQADLKTLGALGVHGLSAVTAVVVETPLVVQEVSLLSPALVQDQVRLLLDTYPVVGIKAGMLGSKAMVVAVAEILAEFEGWSVVDPVMAASAGGRLLDEGAQEALAQRLLPGASVITPNLAEAGVLLGEKERGDPEEEAWVLARRYGAAIYLKGGHGLVGGRHRDVVVEEGRVEIFEHDHLELPSAPGTGCTLASALAGHLAHGEDFFTAALGAHDFTQRALTQAYQVRTRSGEELAHLRHGG